MQSLVGLGSNTQIPVCKKLSTDKQSHNVEFTLVTPGGPGLSVGGPMSAQQACVLETKQKIEDPVGRPETFFLPQHPYHVPWTLRGPLRHSRGPQKALFWGPRSSQESPWGPKFRPITTG